MRQLFFATLLLLGSVARAQTVEELLNKGMVQDSLQHYYQAIALYSRAIDMDPTQPLLFYNRANSYMNTRQYSLALVDFNKCILLDTSITDAYFNRHLANRYTGNYQFALADVSDYLARVPDDLDALDARADLAVEMKDYDLAVTDIRHMLKLKPNKTTYKSRLAEILALKKDYAAAEEVYTALLTDDPDNFPIYLSRAYVRYNAGKYEGSVSDINLFSLRQPGFTEALKLKADNYFYMKKFGDAAELYKSLLVSDTMNASLLADYGHCLLQLKDYEKADNVLTKSILLRGDTPAYAYLGRGIARLNLGKGDLACQDWTKSFMLGEKRAKEYLDKYCTSQEKPLPPR